LTLEILEQRDCPSGPTTGFGISSEVLTVNVAATGSQKNVLVSGTLTGAPNNANQAIVLSGVVSDTVRTDANGNFSATEKASGLGNVAAQTYDQLSNLALANLSVAKPVIETDANSTFTYSEYLGVWTFSGHVSQGQLDGMTVTINNGKTLNNVAVNVNAFGNFVWIGRLCMPYDQGACSAQATDVWGQNSDYAWTSIY
jgi:hypothetical protein